MNEQGLFNVEYADILGIPFDFTAKPVVVKPTKPAETVRVHAMRPDRDALEISFPRVEGYRVELQEERLEAQFGPQHRLELTPDMVGATVTENRGIIGEGVDLTLKHLEEVRDSTVLFHLARHLIYHTYRDPGEEPKLHLFGQMKRIARQWLDGGYLVCKGETKPALLLYRQLADMAAGRIKAAITETLAGTRPVKAMLDAYNPIGSSAFVNFNTSKDVWKTAAEKCHVNWVVTDSDWEAEFCRVAEKHPRVLAYVKNQGLGLEVPYLLAGEPRRYRPDFILRINDGQAQPLNLIVEIKGYRGQDAIEKANTMNSYWVPGVNILEVPAWIDGGPEPSTVREGVFRAERLRFMRTRQSAAYKGVHALLMGEGAIDFRSGQAFGQTIFFDENVDIHHIFPQDWCRKERKDVREFDTIINKTPLGYRTNRTIGGAAPSAYLAKLEAGGKDAQALAPGTLDDYLRSHAIDPALLRADAFDAFMADRETRLLALISAATGHKISRGGAASEEGEDVIENALEADLGTTASAEMESA